MSYTTGHVTPWWDNSFKNLNFIQGYHLNSADVDQWVKEGYPPTTSFKGMYCNITKDVPVYVEPFFNLFEWENVTINFFKMVSGDILPVHRDHYYRYKEMFNITNPSIIHRGIVFLEDWKSGHYIEIENCAIVHWQAGDFVYWCYDTPHMAFNMGIEPRYTVQITGSIKQ